MRKEIWLIGLNGSSAGRPDARTIWWWSRGWVAAEEDERDRAARRREVAPVGDREPEHAGVEILHDPQIGHEDAQMTERQGRNGGHASRRSSNCA
jgi:hypothetical protein